MTSEL